MLMDHFDFLCYICKGGLSWFYAVKREGRAIDLRKTDTRFAWDRSYPMMGILNFVIPARTRAVIFTI